MLGGCCWDLIPSTVFTGAAGCHFHGERDFEAWQAVARQPVVMPGFLREQSHSKWVARETVPSWWRGVGRKQRYRRRKTGRRWEWQKTWEAGRRQPSESAWWGALKPGREAQAGQVLPQPGEPSSPGWHLVHAPSMLKGRKAKESRSHSRLGQVVKPLLSPSEIKLAQSHPNSIQCSELVSHLTRGAIKIRLGGRAFQWLGFAPWLAAQRGCCTGSSFALAACATPSNGHTPLNSGELWADIHPDAGTGDARLWVGTCPQRQWQLLQQQCTQCACRRLLKPS